MTCARLHLSLSHQRHQQRLRAHRSVNPIRDAHTFEACANVLMHNSLIQKSSTTTYFYSAQTRDNSPKKKNQEGGPLAPLFLHINLFAFTHIFWNYLANICTLLLISLQIVNRVSKFYLVFYPAVLQFYYITIFKSMFKLLLCIPACFGH